MGIAHIATLGLAALSATAGATTTDPVVRAPAGAVRGRLTDGQHVFKGIPYALPPVGGRRWQPPAPVFVWIHGGNLIRGSSQQALFDGANLAKRGIVVVSINYRLGVFGYFAHRELSAESADGISGNYGLLDQIAALNWVKTNIGAFGGDAANVTIAGESAGGLAILHLLASPRAQGLYSKAIVQNASLMNIPALKSGQFGFPSAEAAGDFFTAAAGVKSIAELRALDSSSLTTLATKARFAATAIVDGRILPRQLVETFERGEQAHVPLMTGFTSGEIRAMRSVPSARNQPAWPAHNKAAAYMLFAGKPQVAADLMPGQYELHEQVVCRRRAAGNIPWNWNVGVTSPPLPPAQETCR